MDNFIFDLQLFAPDGEGEQGGGTPPDGEGGGEQGGGSSSSDITWTGATTYTAATVTSGENYTSTNADENAVLISTTATVTLNDATVTKSGGTSASDNYSFYGINSAVMCMGGGTTSIIGGTVTTDAAGANGVFSYGANNGTTNATGDGTTVYVKNVTINTTGQGSGGIMTTYGGTTVAENLTITTDGGSSAPIRTDRGGGWVTVTGGTYTSNGTGSPAIYSTAAVTVNDATLISNQSEGVCIEGAGTIALSNCTLTANNTNMNGNATFYDTIMIYQSQSGDASDGTSAFSMTGGTLNSQKGHVFHVTNTTAVINLDGVTINNSDSNNILLSVCDDGWSGADNVVTLNASNQTLEGDILVGDDSTLTLNLTASTFTGNISGEITNAKGSTVSSEIGTVNVTLDSDSKWYLTGDTYVTDFNGDAANVISNGFTLYENGVAVDGITNMEGNGMEITNNTSNSLISGTEYADTISNGGAKVTIDALGGNDEIDNGGSQVSISGGAGNDKIVNATSYVTIDAGEGDDTIENGGAYVSIIGGAGNDSIYHYAADSTIDAGDGNNIISLRAGNRNVIISSGNDTLYFNETLYGSNLSLTTISAEVSSTSVDGDNVIITTDNGSLTIVNGKNASLNLNGDVTVISGSETSADEVCKIGDVTYTSLQDAANAANGGETITLLKDIAATETIDFGVGMSQTEGEVTLDLAGYTISGSVANNGLINVGASRTLTVTGDGTISNSAGMTIHVKGSLNVESGTISSSESAIVNYGTTKISGGYFSGEILNDGGTLEITGGTFDTDISNYVIDGYSAAQTDDGVYVVSAISDDDTALNTANSEDNTLIAGTALNDTISNEGEKVTIDAAAGDDLIANNNLDASISGGEGNDSIYNYGYTSTISANDGDDYIENGGAHVSISGGEGDDTILTYNNFSTIDAGAGNNIISIESGEGNVIMSSGNDTLYGYNSTSGTISAEISNASVDGNNVVLTTDGGTLTVIDGKGETLNINGVESVIGDDSGEGLNIVNSDNDSVITGTAYNDSITNSGDNVSMSGGAGNDALYNTGNNVTIDAGDGNNEIAYVYAENGSINAGSGNDSVTAIEAANIFINAGDGDNYVFNGYVYNDENNNLVDKESLGASTSSTILAGSGIDLIVNQGIYNASVDAGDGDNVISIYHSYTNTLKTGSGNDLIDVSRGGSLSVYTGDGNDSIIGHLATLQTDEFDNWAFGGGAVIDAGAGDDYISLHYSDNSSILGGAGNDTIINNGANTTIDGGEGDDYIELTNNLREETGEYEPQVIVAGAGNDTITGVTSNTSITGTFTDSTVDGANVILTTDNGNLTIIDGAGQTLNINGAESVISGDSSGSGDSDDNDTIGAAVAEFILKRTEKGYPALCDTGLFEPDTVGSAAPEGYLSENWTITSADNLKLSGVHYSPENPTGQWIMLVTGYGQVGATMNLPAAILLAMGYDVLVIDPRASGNSEGDWLTMGVAECVDVALWTQKIAETNANAQITLYGISMGAATVMMAAALSETTNVTSLIEDCGYANIYSIFENIVNAIGESYGWTVPTEELFEKVADATESLTGYNVGNAVPLDSIGDVTVPSMFIHGTADTLVPVEDVQKLYDASGAAVKEMWTVEGAGHAKSITEDPFTYLVKATSLIDSANEEEIGASITSTDSDKLLRGTVYDDTISAVGDNVTIDALTGNDDIFVLSDNVSINTGEGNNTVSAFESAQLYITTGDGDNSIENIYIKYDETKDAFVNYDSTTSSTIVTGNGNDTISNQGVYKGVVDAGEGDNYVELDHSYENTVTTGAGNDTLIVERGSSVTAYTGDGDDSIIGQKSTVTGGSNWAFGGGAVIDAGAGNDYIAPSYTNNSSLFGGAGNDTIITNGKETTINGGEGDDYIELTDEATGEYESAVIVASAGNDSIKNYSDVVSLQGTFTSTELDGDNVILTSDEGTLTIIDGTGKALNINGESTIILTDAGSSATVDGKTFALTENVADGVTVKTTENGFEISHVITAEEVESFQDAEITLSESDVGKTFTETVTVTGDDSYSVELIATGIDAITKISDGANIKASVKIDGETFEKGTTLDVVTDSTGTVTLGDKSYKIQNDNSVILFGKFVSDGTYELRDVDDLTGAVAGDFNGTTSINGAEITISDGADNASISAADSFKIIGGVNDGASITAENAAVSVNELMTINDITYNVSGDSNGVVVDDKEVVGLDADASLTVSEAGSYTVNTTPLEVAEGDVVIGLNSTQAYIDNGQAQLNPNSTTEEILDAFDVAASDAVIIPATAEGEQRVTLGNEGGVAVVEDTETPVTITGGSGDDTLVTKGDNVKFNMGYGGTDKVMALGGNVTLQNYDPRGESGLQLTKDDMKEGVKFGDGTIELANATVSMNDNFVNLYDVAGNKSQVGFATNDDKLVDASGVTEGVSLLAGGENVTNAVTKATLQGGSGDDTIYGGEKSQIKPGAGNDFVEMSSLGGSTVNYTSGNDTISGLNFAGGDVAADTIRAAVTESSLSGDDVILTTDNGTITIEDAKNKDIVIGNEIWQVGDNIEFDDTATKYIAKGSEASLTATELSGDSVGVALDSIEGDVKYVDLSSYEGAASITGSSDADNVITASEGGSTIDGNGGNNSLKGGSGADEFISSSGENTIANFEFYTAENKNNADKLNTGAQAISGVKVSGDDIILKYDDGSAKVEGASGQTMQIQNEHTSATPILAQFADDSLTVDEVANFYWAGGKNAAVIVGDGLDSKAPLVADLSNANFNNAEQKSFYGDIKELDASGFAGAAELTGNNKNNIITASEGGSTLNGGGGNNSLKGGSGADEFISESGKNTIANFEFYAGNNDDTADMLNLGAQAISGVNVSGDDVILKYDGGLAKVEDAAGQTIQLQNEHTGETPILAQFAKDSLTVDDTANFYWASGKNATVSVGNYSGNLEVDLNNADFNDTSKLSFYGDIREIDASGYNKYTELTGNDKNNVLKAGNSASDLWGGNGGNDTLIGGDDVDIFIYKKGNGDDVIENISADDLISFRDLTLDDIMKVECTDSSIKFKFSGGGSVTAKTDSPESVQFAIGEVTPTTYTYNKTTGEFDEHGAGSY